MSDVRLLVGALKRGDAREALRCLATSLSQLNPNTRDDTGASLLHLAVDASMTAVVQQLLQAGANVNARNAAQETPLVVAARNGAYEILHSLLTFGADVEAKDAAGMTALSLAARNPAASLDLVVLLLSFAARVDTVAHDGSTPLMFAAQSGRQPVVDALLFKAPSAYVNAQNRQLSTALMFAAENGHANVVKLLLDNGADAAATNGLWQNALDLAKCHGHDATVRLLVNHGHADPASLFEPSILGWSPLFTATIKGDPVVFQNELARNGGHVDVRNGEGWTPLMCAAMKGFDELVLLLLARGADVNAMCPNGYTPLIFAARRGHESTVQVLLKGGAEINVINGRGRTALLCAAFRKHEKIARLLLAHGAAVAAVDDLGRNALMWVAETGCSEELADALLERGCDPDAVDNAGDTALSLAVESGHSCIVRSLLSRGASMAEAERQTCLSMLHVSALLGKQEVLRVLLEARALPVNSCGADGVTALHLAAREGHEDAARVLLDHGADPDRPDAKGRTPIEVASAERHVDVVLAMREAQTIFVSQCSLDIFDFDDPADPFMDLDSVSAPSSPPAEAPVAAAVPSFQTPGYKPVGNRARTQSMPVDLECGTHWAKADAFLSNRRPRANTVDGRFSRVRVPVRDAEADAGRAKRLRKGSVGASASTQSFEELMAMTSDETAVVLPTGPPVKTERHVSATSSSVSVSSASSSLSLSSSSLIDISEVAKPFMADAMLRRFAFRFIRIPIRTVISASSISMAERVIFLYRIESAHERLWRARIFNRGEERISAPDVDIRDVEQCGAGDAVVIGEQAYAPATRSDVQAQFEMVPSDVRTLLKTIPIVEPNYQNWSIRGRNLRISGFYRRMKYAEACEFHLLCTKQQNRQVLLDTYSSCLGCDVNDAIQESVENSLRKLPGAADAFFCSCVSCPERTLHKTSILTFVSRTQANKSKAGKKSIREEARVLLSFLKAEVDNGGPESHAVLIADHLRQKGLEVDDELLHDSWHRFKAYLESSNQAGAFNGHLAAAYGMHAFDAPMGFMGG